MDIGFRSDRSVTSNIGFQYRLSIIQLRKMASLQRLKGSARVTLQSRFSSRLQGNFFPTCPVRFSHSSLELESISMPETPFFTLPSSVLRSVRIPGRGRALITARAFEVGELLFVEKPLIAVGDVFATNSTCSKCFMPLAASTSPVRCGCGYSYCSKSCLDAHTADGHDVVCGSLGELDEFCKQHRINYPRVAAGALARSLGGGVDFMQFWQSMQALVTLPVPPDADTLPPLTHEGYALVKRAVSPSMEGDSEGFWSFAFDVKTYARLLGTLRLNSFAVALHDVQAAHAAATKESGLPTNGDAGGGCGSSDHACASHTDGGSASGCGEGSGCDSHGFSEPRGGTAVYAISSLINHSCEPSADALLYAGASLEVRARTALSEGDEVTISYLGPTEAAVVSGTPDASTSGPAFAQRRAELAAGYGFECKCGRCVAESAAALRGKRPEGSTEQAPSW